MHAKSSPSSYISPTLRLFVCLSVCLYSTCLSVCMNARPCLHSWPCPNVPCLCAVYAPCLYAPCQYAPYPYVPCLNALCLNAPWLNAPCLYASCLHAPCLYAPCLHAPCCMHPVCTHPVRMHPVSMLTCLPKYCPVCLHTCLLSLLFFLLERAHLCTPVCLPVSF